MSMSKMATKPYRVVSPPKQNVDIDKQFDLDRGGSGVMSYIQNRCNRFY